MIYLDHIRNSVKGKKVLALGCAGYSEAGTESVLKRILDIYAREWQGVDNNEEYVTKTANVVYGDLNKGGWYGRVYHPELIVMTEVLEHLENPVGCLRGLAAVFPGVSFLMSVPNGGSFGRALHGICQTILFTFQDRYHLHLYNRTTISNTFRAAGVKSFRTEYYTHSKAQRLVPRVLWSGMFVEGVF